MRVFPYSKLELVKLEEAPGKIPEANFSPTKIATVKVSEFGWFNQPKSLNQEQVWLLDGKAARRSYQSSFEDMSSYEPWLYEDLTEVPVDMCQQLESWIRIKDRIENIRSTKKRLAADLKRYNSQKEV